MSRRPVRAAPLRPSGLLQGFGARSGIARRLRAAGTQHQLPGGRLTRAWVLHAGGGPADADLREAQRIAKRGGMALHLADIALTRARLFRDRAALAEARRLIEQCSYSRRVPELQDAEAAAAGW